MEWVSGESSVGAVVFVVLVCVWVYFCCCRRECVKDCRGLGLCKVGIVGWSVGGEYEGGRGSLVTEWGRIEGKVKAGGREWVRRGRVSCWRGEQ
jgi:hypothetical protein